MAIQEIQEMVEIGRDVIAWAEDNFVQEPTDLYGWLQDVADGNVDVDVDEIMSLSSKADALSGKFEEGLSPQDPDLNSSLWWMARTAMNMVGTIAVNISDIVEFFERCDPGDGDEAYYECIDEQLDAGRIDGERVWNVLYGRGTPDSYGQPFVDYIEELEANVSFYQDTVGG